MTITKSIYITPLRLVILKTLAIEIEQYLEWGFYKQFYLVMKHMLYQPQYFLTKFSWHASFVADLCKELNIDQHIKAQRSHWVNDELHKEKTQVKKVE